MIDFQSAFVQTGMGGDRPRSPRHVRVFDVSPDASSVMREKIWNLQFLWSLDVDVGMFRPSFIHGVPPRG
jgi:hypothetical protein